MQIPTLSNRSVGFVLLGLIAVLSYWGIRYVFLLNIGSLRFEVLDGSSYFVILKKANIEVSSLNCQQACTFADIPAGRYQYTASSSGRLVKTEQVDILREKINTILLQSNLDVKSWEVVQKIAEESERYQVRTQPVRLLDMERDKLVLTSSESAVGYSTDSLPYGYFMMFDANRVITIYEIATHKIRLISWTLPEFPTHIKLLANHKSFVLYTKNAAYLSDIDTRALEELKSYDDIETSPSGSIIALIRSSSQQKKQYYNLQAVPGDLLLDISVAGTPKLLHAEVSDVKMLYWDNAFWVQKTNGDRQLLNIR